MKRFLLALACLAAPAIARAQPVDGPYVSLGGGLNLLQDVHVGSFSIDGAPVKVDNYAFHPGEVGLASVGYGFGNGLRLELEGSYRSNGVAVSPNEAGATSRTGQEDNYGGMLNGLYDIDLGLPFVQPYVGAGVGVQWTHLTEHLAGPPEEIQGYRGGTDARFAYQAILGAAFPVPGVPGLAVTAEYRFMGLAGDHTVSGTRTLTDDVFVTGAFGPVRITTNGDDNHSFLLGLRYAFGGEPAPVPPPAAPAPAASPTRAVAPAARTYLVFFDWDKADLSARARQIIAQAAQAATATAATRVEVDGYTDRSGTVGYNQALGLRRAQAVGAELVRDGVPAAAIAVTSFGETHPLVPTTDGVREPQNRRVEIILH